MTALQPPAFMQARSDHSAEVLRKAILTMFGSHAVGGGFTTRGGVQPEHGNRMNVTQTGSPSMAVIVKQGTCVIQGTESGNQGVYVCHNDADVTLTVPTAPGPGQSRIDIVQARVRDAAYSGGNNDWVLEVKAGTAAATGTQVAPNTDANGIALALINVGPSVTSINNGNIVWFAAYLNALGGYIEAPNTFYHPPVGTVRSGQRVHTTNDEISKIWNATLSTWDKIDTVQEGTYTPGTPSGFNLGATGSKAAFYKLHPAIRMIYFSATFQFNGAGSAVPAGPTFFVDLPPSLPPSDYCQGSGWYDWGVRPLGWRGIPGNSQIQVKSTDGATYLTNFTPGFTWLNVAGWYPY